VAVAALLLLAAVAALLLLSRGGEPASATALAPRADVSADELLAYDPRDAGDLERAAAFGLSHALYAKSPGGVHATAERTAAFRDLVEEAVSGSGLDPDLVEAIVFLESGGRPDVIAGDDPARASGLTQILAGTGANFLGMKVDLEESRALTARIAGAVRRGDTAEAELLRARRRAIDERFDPTQALAGTVRYLTEARRRLGRDDLAVVSYHMGIGNLSRVLRAYARGDPNAAVPDLAEENDLSWTRVFFDSTPVRHRAAYRLLARLSDDSPTYYWRVLAAGEIMRLYRDDPERLEELDLLHATKASAEEVLHPPAETERFADGEELERAWAAHALQTLPDDPGLLWFEVDPTLGELAGRLGRPRALYGGLREEALAVLVLIAARVHDLSGATQPLQVTSAVRDDEYQSLLRAGNPEATAGYSLHTTGYAFDIRRRYESGAQARAFQFTLDDLTARGLIAWVREAAAIHVTVSPEAARLVPLVLEPA
jgi:soluble lytic murein transglycosylase-like protein